MLFPKAIRSPRIRQINEDEKTMQRGGSFVRSASDPMPRPVFASLLAPSSPTSSKTQPIDIPRPSSAPRAAGFNFSRSPESQWDMHASKDATDANSPDPQGEQPVFPCGPQPVFAFGTCYEPGAWMQPGQFKK